MLPTNNGTKTKIVFNKAEIVISSLPFDHCFFTKSNVPMHKLIMLQVCPQAHPETSLIYWCVEGLLIAFNWLC